jgi:alpha-tubulin suppressor-like RCC1 family protein
MCRKLIIEILFDFDVAQNDNRIRLWKFIIQVGGLLMRKIAHIILASLCVAQVFGPWPAAAQQIGPWRGANPVSASASHSLGLKSDGRIAGWGDNYYGQTTVPAPNANFVSVSAGYYHSLGLKSDGSIAAWGWNGYGQATVPAPNASFVVVSAGFCHSLGLKSNGSIIAWGTMVSVSATWPLQIRISSR